MVILSLVGPADNPEVEITSQSQTLQTIDGKEFTFRAPQDAVQYLRGSRSEYDVTVVARAPE